MRGEACGAQGGHVRPRREFGPGFNLAFSSLSSTSFSPSIERTAFCPFSRISHPSNPSLAIVRARANRPRRLNPPKTHHDGLQARRTSVLRTASRRPALCVWWSTRSIPGPATAGLLPARASPDGIPATRLPSSTARLPSSARLSSPAGRLSSSAGLSSSARRSSPRILPSSAGWRFEIRRPHDWSAGRSGMLLLSGLPLLDAKYIETGGW
ncbi:hypothetical protein BGZ61DRAFT_86221 [Ilyonectria robusta]|uniref:uncharacterized protein n=1 Tax=Ilyonectria robusta TaxID=1079257 RepID=UPI001E8CC79B|nr:uncharacterized protein BGZ61DRAFT_86221 [Ilyonectria robusta]KAH8735812.1 hypothetical protein BGZ61DRAFT_86221 [Ilyonectria robusta]